MRFRRAPPARLLRGGTKRARNRLKTLGRAVKMAVRLCDAADAGLSAAEPALHRPAVPVDELPDPILMGRRVGSRFIDRRANAELVFFDHATVLIVCREPNVGQVLDRIVFSLDGVLVNKPFRPELGLHWTKRKDLKADGVIAQHVIPGRGIVEEQERSDAGL